MKVKPETIIKEISNDFLTYLKAGNINTKSFTKKIDRNIKIENFDNLLKIHFVLKKDVINFVSNLEDRIRQIKTTVKKDINIFNGKVKGRINWRKTISERYSKNPKNKMLFACSQREKNYNISENLVLKKLLQTINQIVYKDVSYAFDNEYEWFEEWFKEDNLRQELNKFYHKNVYLRRISLEKVKITNRMIQRAKKSRQILYKEAAKLLEEYNKIINWEINEKEAMELLKNTFIEPKKPEVLFELYWVFKILKQFDNPKLKLINPGNDFIASWNKDSFNYKLYHDSTGSFNFKETFDSIKEEDNFLGRELKVIKKLKELKLSNSDSLWGGRPDIMLERYKGGKIESVFIGEVKYTENKNYSIQGLKELLEYIALIKNKKGYHSKFDNLFNNLNNIKGGLFLCKDLIGIDESNLKVFSFDSDFSNIFFEI